MFLETSALTGENVEETFLKCARQILTKIELGKREQSHGKYMYHFIQRWSITGALIRKKKQQQVKSLQVFEFES